MPCLLAFPLHFPQQVTCHFAFQSCAGSTQVHFLPGRTKKHFGRRRHRAALFDKFLILSLQFLSKYSFFLLPYHGSMFGLIDDRPSIVSIVDGSILMRPIFARSIVAGSKVPATVLCLLDHLFARSMFRSIVSCSIDFLFDIFHSVDFSWLIDDFLRPVSVRYESA